MKNKILLTFLLLVTINIHSQSSLRESWSVGAGFNNFIINGDLKAKNSFLNIGAYLSLNKMVSPSVGFELRFGYNNMSGQGKDSQFKVNNVSIDNTYFEGSSINGEANIIYNISNLFNIHKNVNRKFNFSTLLGIGLQRYNSTLYDSRTDEIIADYGNSPSLNGTTGSMYYTAALNIKYKLSNNLDLEFRQSFNINEEDHLDAAVVKNTSLDYFYKTNIGISYNFNKKEHKNFAWYDKSDIIFEKPINDDLNDNAEEDGDQDGVINKYDIEKDTPKGAIVYGNGVAIDSDQDGIIDLYDKCPLEFAKTKTGCLKDVDTDNDGVIDSEDECPTIFGEALNGCPKEKNIEIVKATPKILTEEEKHKLELIKEVNKKNTVHGNKDLDTSVNINDVDTSPIYPDCVDKITQFDKTNCIISSISAYVYNNYNKQTANSIKGKVRVLFIVKEDGSTKVIDILGEYPQESKQELKRVLETLPKIQPGTLKGIPVPVKYSLLFLLK